MSVNIIDPLTIFGGTRTIFYILKAYFYQFYINIDLESAGRVSWSRPRIPWFYWIIEWSWFQWNTSFSGLFIFWLSPSRHYLSVSPSQQNILYFHLLTHSLLKYFYVNWMDQWYNMNHLIYVLYKWKQVEIVVVSSLVVVK